jgi:hypothetical protein
MTQELEKKVCMNLKTQDRVRLNYDLLPPSRNIRCYYNQLQTILVVITSYIMGLREY